VRYADLSPEAKERKKAARRAAYAASREQELERQREYRTNLTPEQRERQQARMRDYLPKWHAAHPDYRKRAEVLTYNREWKRRDRVLHPGKVRRQQATTRIKRQYGISIDRYEELLAAQQGVCAICHQPERVVINAVIAMLGVDHDHSCCPGKRSCGKCVRGLLCSRCGRGCGVLGDNPVTLRAAADYMESWRT
jgi:hypothetical protein